MSIKPETNGDGSLFKNRLGKLMNRDGYKNANELARALYDRELVSVNSKRTGITFEEDIKKNAIGSIVKVVRKHMTSDNVASVQGRYIDAYCQLFNCSADYLLGYSDVVSQDTTVQGICSATCLSEKTVQRLMEPKYQQGLSELLSYMLEDDKWADALACYWPQLVLAAYNYSYTQGYLHAIDMVLEEHKGEETFTLMNIEIQRKAIDKQNINNNDRYDSKMYALSTCLMRSFEDAFYRKVNEDDWNKKAYDEAYKKYSVMAQLNEDIEKDFEFNEHDLNELIQNEGKYHRE